MAGDDSGKSVLILPGELAEFFTVSARAMERFEKLLTHLGPSEEKNTLLDHIGRAVEQMTFLLESYDRTVDGHRKFEQEERKRFETQLGDMKVMIERLQNTLGDLSRRLSRTESQKIGQDKTHGGPRRSVAHPTVVKKHTIQTTPQQNAKRDEGVVESNDSKEAVQATKQFNTVLKDQLAQQQASETDVEKK